MVFLYKFIIVKRILNFRDFNVFLLEKESWDIDYHNHNFYEIILVQEGSGLHRLNDVTFPFKVHDVFLLTPSDAHEFVLYEKTTFIYIKFTEQFVLDNLVWLRQSSIKEQMRLLMAHKPLIYASLIKTDADVVHIFQLGQILLKEFTRRGSFQQDLIAQVFSSILIIIARNLALFPQNKNWLDRDGDRLDKILSYISIYVTDKDKMRIESLAKEFLMSKNYISAYVKSRTGISIQKHVLQFKLKAAEKLLQQSDFHINEIATRLGFTDASHFNKIFQQHYDISPSRYRQQFVE